MSTIDKQVLDFKTRNAEDPPTPIAKPRHTFDTGAFLRSAAVGATIATYRPSEVIYSQGDASVSVLYVEEGAVKLSVLSPGGREAVIGMVELGAFFGESAMAGRPARQEMATAMLATTVLIVPKQQMIRLLHAEKALSDRFITHMLARNIRMAGDLVDQLLNSSEKRLARTLLLLAHYGKPGKTHRVLPRISQATLAEMIGTTRSRVNVFMKKFEALGFIEYNDGLTINNSLLTVVLSDEHGAARPRRTG